MKFLILCLLGLFSMSVYAHTGHGETDTIAHDLTHILWYVSGAALFLLVFFIVYKKR